MLSVHYSNISQIYDYRSVWIKDEYCTNIDGIDNRVEIYESACCSLSFINN